MIALSPLKSSPQEDPLLSSETKLFEKIVLQDGPCLPLHPMQEPSARRIKNFFITTLESQKDPSRPIKPLPSSGKILKEGRQYAVLIGNLASPQNKNELHFSKQLTGVKGMAPTWAAFSHQHHSIFIRKLFAAQDFVDNIDLIHSFTPIEKLLLVHALFESLAELHKLSIVHCDIKLDNLLLHPTKGGYKIAFCDFGVCHKKGKQLLSKPLGGTKEYLPPEVWNALYDPDLKDQATIQPSRDIWSLGCCSYFFLSKAHLDDLLLNLRDLAASFSHPAKAFCHPFDAFCDRFAKTAQQARQHLAQPIGHSPPYTEGEVEKLLTDLCHLALDPAPQTRPTAAQVLRLLGQDPRFAYCQKQARENPACRQFFPFERKNRP